MNLCEVLRRVVKSGYGFICFGYGYILFGYGLIKQPCIWFRWLDLTNRHPLSPATLLRGGFMPSIMADRYGPP